MTESRELTLVVDGRLDERLVERAFEAAAEGPRGARIRNGLEAAIDAAETDPDGAREALWTLRRDRVTLERLERCLDGDPERATLALGAAIQLAHAELASRDPDLRSRMPELLRWLEGDW
jgi:predicted exporter